jgi:hypothetical protein
MENEIKMPAGIAKCVIESFDAMVDSGKWFSDKDEGEKLLLYLADNHTIPSESGILLAIQKRTNPPML